MSLFRPFLPALLAPTALVAAADAPLDAAAARELAEIRPQLANAVVPTITLTYAPECLLAYLDIVHECYELLDRYEATGSVAERSSPHGISMLHLACLMHKPELVRALLAAGADPNLHARDRRGGRDADTPLVSCVYDAFPGLPPLAADTRRRLVDMLLAAGADAKGKAGGQALLVSAAADYEGAEDIALHLLAQGADPRQGNHLFDSDEFWLACKLRYLMVSGKSRFIDALLSSGRLPELTTHGVDLLCSILSFCKYGCNEDEAAGIAQLLRHGADVHRQDYTRHCAADFIHENPDLLARLEARGLAIPRHPYTLRAEHLAEDLRELPWLANPPLETLAPHFDSFALLITAHLAGELGHERARLLKFMLDLDRERTVELVMQLPQWQAARGWTAEENAFFEALLETPGLVLPADWLRTTAERLCEAGAERCAHELIHLLARCPQAQAAPIAEQLCADPRPALASAAWSLRLKLAGVMQPGWDWADPPLRQRLERLENALEVLTDNSEAQGHFLDFSQAANDIAYIDVLPTLVSGGEWYIPKTEGCWRSERDELLRTLRGRGLGEAADYCARLFELRAQLYSDEPPPEEAPESGDEAIDPEADYEEPDPSVLADEREDRGIIDELSRLGQLPEAKRHAFGIEAALGRLIWELYQEKQVK